MSLDGDIGAAVDKAVASQGQDGPPPSTPAAPSSQPSVPAAASPAAAPAARSGSEPAPTAGRSTDAATRRPSPARGVPDRPLADQPPKVSDPSKPVAPPTPPGATAEPASSPPADPAPPAEKWGTVLDNARIRERERFGITGEMEPENVAAHLTLLDRNPVEYYRILGENLRRNGMLPAADAPPGGPAREPAADATLPKPDLITTDGITGYSADRVQELIQFHIGAFRRELAGEIGPLQQQAHESRVEAIKASAWNSAAAQLKEARDQWDDFSTLEPEIKTLMKADGRATLLSAYNTVYQRHVKTRHETLRRETRQQTIDELTKAPAVSTETPSASVNGGRGNRTRGGSLDDRIGRAFDRAVADAGSR